MAVGAARRLHCAARSGVAPQNSLRSLRSLRSNNCGESEDEARAARAPTPALRCSSPQKSPPPGTACREVHHWWRADRRGPLLWLQRRVRAGCSAPLRRREAQDLWPRAQRASSSDSAQLFERRERSERSEFCAGPQGRASQGSRRAAPAASVKRCGLPGRAFAAPISAHKSGRQRSAQGRKAMSVGVSS